MATIPEEDEETDPSDQDTLVFDFKEFDEDLFDTTVDTTSDDSAIMMGKPIKAAFISDLVQIPTDKIGCSHVTHHLQAFLEQYPTKSKEQAFEHVYQILQVLEKYLTDNPMQYQHCMSPDNEHITCLHHNTWH